MSDERARRIHDLFGRALELEPAERRGFVERTCAPATREEILDLLRAHDEMEGFLERPAAERLDLPVSFEPGSLIGAYKIVRRVGAGGGGTVYEAEQKSPRRRVALKVRHAALGSSGAQHRFREEAEILARLDHPDVAHVYEAGVHKGLPWFAMEFVADARNVVEHGTGLDQRARLRLFARICDAVHHGHRNGIVHRDLKPGNVLIRPDGQPKIIDFGIAQADGAASEGEGLAGTPAYMSPEQCTPGRRDIDERSDVYSLGVVLYELLSGRVPHDVAGLTAGEATRRVREVSPAPPPIGLEEDLRAILSRALERDPEARYPSAAYLAEEVRRFLAFEPVVAARGGRLHHARLFARRNPVVVGSVIALVLVLAGGVLVSSRFAYRATEARDREREEADLARLAAAHAALRVHDVREARRLLGLVSPERRGFEWNHLAGRLDRSEATSSDVDIHEPVAIPMGGGFLALGESRAAPGTSALLSFGDGPPERRAFGGIPSSRIARGGGRIAWGTYDGWVVVLDATTLEVAATIRAYEEPTEVRSVAFAPGGDRIVSTGRIGGVVVCDVLPAAVVARIDRAAVEARFSPDGLSLALATTGSDVEIRDAGDLRLVRTLSGHESRVTAILFEPAGGIVTASTDGTARIWDADGREVARLVEPRGEPIHCADLSADGARLLTGHQDGTIVLWDVRERRLLETHWGHDGWIKSVSFLDDGRALTASSDGTIKRWQLLGGDPARLGRFQRLARDVEYSRDGRWLGCAVADGTVRLFDLEEDRAETILGGRGGVAQALAFRPDGGRVASVSSDGEIRVHEIPGGSLVRSLAGGLRANLAVAYDPEGRLLVTGGQEGVRTWDAESLEPRLDLGTRSWIWAARFTPDGRSLVATGAGGWFHVWDARTGAVVREMQVTDGEISSAAFTDGGRTLVTGGERRIDVWDTGTWRVRATHVLPVDYIQGVAPSPDGARVAVASWGNVRLIDPVSGRTTIEMRDHRAIVWAVAFHPDGTQFASAAGGYEGQGCEVRLWGRLPGVPWPPVIR